MRTREIDLDWFILPERTVATIYQVAGNTYIYMRLRGARRMRIMLDWPGERWTERTAANET